MGGGGGDRGPQPARRWGCHPDGRSGTRGHTCAPRPSPMPSAHASGCTFAHLRTVSLLRSRQALSRPTTLPQSTSAIPIHSLLPMPSKFLPRDRAWGTRYDTLGSSPPSSPTLQRSATENVHSSTISPTSPRELLHSVEGLPALEGRPPEKPDHPDTTPHDASIFVGRSASLLCFLQLFLSDTSRVAACLPMWTTLSSAGGSATTSRPILKSKESRSSATVGVVFARSFSVMWVCSPMSRRPTN